MISNQLHVYQTIVDFDLIDAGNVVYHPNYLILCERARNAALFDAGCSFQELWSEGIALALAECHSRYVRPLVFAQKIAVITTLKEYSGTRLMVHQEMISADSLSTEEYSDGFSKVLFEPTKKDVYFQADFVLASVTLNPLKATRLPKKLADALNLRVASRTSES
jgi:YbgC/YbaW family acyl-CoA thioester hydrolase